jgi:Outer membrane protein beta-barrel domain
MLRLHAGGLAAAIALAAGPVHAQGVRQGFWVRAGAGYASAKADCRECVDAPFHSAFSWHVSAGGTPSRHVRFGGELFGLTRDDVESRARIYLLTGAAQWYPWSNAGFYTKVGYGLSRGTVDFVSGGVTTREGRTGIAVLVGVGWDIPLGSIELSPFGAMYVAGLGDIQTPTVVLRDALSTVWHAGLAVTFP